MLSPDRARQVIETLLAALEASPCYVKAARLGLPSFTILAYDRAGHVALAGWALEAEAHGCRREKVQDALNTLLAWQKRDDLRWPT